MSRPSDGRPRSAGVRAAGPGMPGPQLRLPFEMRPIATERAILRPFAPDDLADVSSFQSLDSVVRYLAWGPQAPDESARYVTERSGMTRLAADGDGVAYAVDVGSASGRRPHVVGEIILLLDSAVHCRLEIGWIFHPEVQGRGYAGEAARAVLDVCFRTILAHRVIAKLEPRNLASARLSERLGMRHEGVMHDDHFLKGEWRSTSVYALLASEYAGEPSPPPAGGARPGPDSDA